MWKFKYVFHFHYKTPTQNKLSSYSSWNTINLVKNSDKNEINPKYIKKNQNKSYKKQNKSYKIYKKPEKLLNINKKSLHYIEKT